LQYLPHWWYKVYFNKVLKCNYNTLILMIISLPFTINVTNLTISSFVSWFKLYSQYGASIVFLLSFGKTMQYPHLLESICLAWYSEHEITIFKKILLFHGLQYYRKMMWVFFFLLGFAKAMQYPSKFQNKCYGTQRFYGILKEG